MREEALAAVEARLQRIRDTGDVSLALQPQAGAEMGQLLELLQSSAPLDLPVRHAVGWMWYFESLSMPNELGRVMQAAAVTVLIPCFLVGVDDLPEPLLPQLADAAEPYATVLFSQEPVSTDPGLLDSDVDLWERIVLATPVGHPNWAERRSQLGTVLLARFECTGDLADLNAAITALREAVQATPIDHPDRAHYLSGLGITLRARYERTGDPADLNAAITALRDAVQAIPVGHPHRTAPLSDLGAALGAQYERTGDPADLDAAITALREAVQATPVDRPERAHDLSGLGTALRARYERTGDLADLNAAITAGQEAAQATPVGHPDRAGRLSNLGSTLSRRFERFGDPADLDTAITALRDAVQATPVGPPQRTAPLSNLGATLRARYERIGDLADLDAAITALREAVEATPIGHPHRTAPLSNLGTTLLLRFERTRDATDLDAAITALRDAVQAIPVGHPHRTAALSNLGTTLRARYERIGDLADLNAAITALREAVEATPTKHPDQTPLHNLGATLRARYERTGDLVDLNAAITALREAVEATPAGHPDQAAYLSNLGTALLLRFERTEDAAELGEATSAFAEAWAVVSAAPALRIRAAWAVASLIVESDVRMASDMAEAAVLLLPEVTPRQLQRSDQQHVLGGLAGLAAVAAALALDDPRGTPQERATRALRLLEAGRAVLLSQALDVRSDLTDLQQQHPDLARRFVELRDRLDQSADTSTIASTNTEGIASAPRGIRAVQDRHQLVRDFAAVLDTIRGLDGFASFGLPPTTEELLTEARYGPVVVFNITQERSDALLLTKDGITHQELPELSGSVLAATVTSFQQALHTAASGADRAERRQAQAVMVRTLEWLWDAAAGPVLEALGYHGQPPAEADWPRVWWVPGGLLGLLPLHAAGYQADPAGDPHRRTVMDRVVSSYTPTVRALRYARQRTSAQDVPEQGLVVAMPTTPGLPGHGRLNYVSAEAEVLRRHLPRTLMLSEPDPASHAATLSPDAPTKPAVLRHLPTNPIVHFACHGASHPTDPSRSHLLLHDHDSDPFTVASLAPVRLDGAQLAYLSACRTAAIDTPDLLDEAIHLTSAFQLAGFPHVIGTLWEIDDQIAVTIADAFYTHLRNKDGVIDTSGAAWALHQAVRGIRDGDDLPGKLNRTQVPFLWAAHLHAGA
ncbi:CHAT domain-containing protein [Streptomyces sp. A012304]|uniref:CHAT domain-containing tetratricopeptide repeat protein n=1 Tax=Streptomyces sp. A012304 TaxID=375446 RepID=UPI00222E578F|nr:CHAT domain-containing protein [Streptomyces sp. A012304]GKQ37457.1 CHAT domain-containing protein [Streptomyces sp. A012304]